MPSSTSSARSGFVLIDALVALFLFTTVFLVIESSWTLASRGLADASRQSVASRLAAAQRERALSLDCAPSSGADSANGVIAAWSASVDRGQLRMSQTARFHWRDVERIDSYDVRGGCE